PRGGGREGLRAYPEKGTRLLHFRSRVPFSRPPSLLTMSPFSLSGCGLCLLGDLLEDPEEKVRERRLDAEPFELGGDLTAVVSRVVDNMAQYRPRRQGRRKAGRPQRHQGVQTLRGERGSKLLEAAVGTLQQLGHVVHGGQVGFGREAINRGADQRAQ